MIINFIAVLLAYLLDCLFVYLFVSVCLLAFCPFVCLLLEFLFICWLDLRVLFNRMFFDCSFVCLFISLLHFTICFPLCGKIVHVDVHQLVLKLNCKKRGLFYVFSQTYKGIRWDLQLKCYNKTSRKSYKKE